MAITVCSTSNPSPTVSLSSFSSKSSLKTPHHLLYPPPKLTFGLSSDDACIIAADAVALANAAARTAREALASAYEVEQNLCYEETRIRKEVEMSEWRNGSLVRRKKRRKRRKVGVECQETDQIHNFQFISAATKSGHYLTKKEEAEYTLFIKEEARLESVRRKILESDKHEPTSNQWGEAVGMKGSDLDKILCSARESRQRVTRCYHRLVVSIASRYQGKGLSLQDLIQEGNIGLFRGAKKFDPERGYKLSTYIYWWIRQAVSKAIANNSRTIRLPGSICEKVPKIAEANTILTKQLMRLPSYDEIAEAADMDVATVRLISRRTLAPISLDQSITGQGCMNLQDIMPGPEEMTPESMLNKQQMKQDLEKLLSVLCDREAHILRLHYGLNGKSPRSYDEIGRVMRLSRERVRQISQTALSKLQQTCLVDNLKVYIYSVNGSLLMNKVTARKKK